MKKISLAIAALLVIVLFAVPMFAAETTTVTVFGVELQVTVVDAIMALLSGGLVTFLTQVLKSKLKSSGVIAFAITLVMCAGTTAVYFLVINPMSPWNWVIYVTYVATVLGESTGYYHLYKKITA